MPTGFFAGFANGGFYQTLAMFQMACWLIQNQSAITLFLDEEEAAVFLDDAGYGDAWAFGGLVGYESHG
jgi:hypothetical protein